MSAFARMVDWAIGIVVFQCIVWFSVFQIVSAAAGTAEFWLLIEVAAVFGSIACGFGFVYAQVEWRRERRLVAAQRAELERRLAVIDELLEDANDVSMAASVPFLLTEREEVRQALKSIGIDTGARYVGPSSGPQAGRV